MNFILTSQSLNLAPYSDYDEDGVQKPDIAFRPNNEVCSSVLILLFVRVSPCVSVANYGLRI